MANLLRGPPGARAGRVNKFDFLNLIEKTKSEAEFIFHKTRYHYFFYSSGGGAAGMLSPRPIGLRISTLVVPPHVGESIFIGLNFHPLAENCLGPPRPNRWGGPMAMVDSAPLRPRSTTARFPEPIARRALAPPRRFGFLARGSPAARAPALALDPRPPPPRPPLWGGI